MRRSFLAGALALAATVAGAQLATPNADWKEGEVPAPPAVRTTGLIPLELPGSTLAFGVEPKSVTIGRDGIVRYVVVASSGTGAVNAFYEGVRCNTGEVKVYARHDPASGWVPLANSEWMPLHQRPNLRHSLLVARTGACIGHGPNRSAEQVVKDLRAPADSRFRYGT